MKKTLYIFCCFIFAVWLSGCGYLSIAINNFGDAIFKSSKKVNTKIRNPIKKNVRMSALWAGHSTILLQLYDKSIIFDPYFNNYLVGFFLRRVETGLDIKYLNKLNLICISHSHMDHMCFSSIGDLSKKFPKAKLVFPYGAENYLPAFNMDMVRIDNRKVTRNLIGKPVFVDSIKITPVYAAHSGGRYGIDIYSWKEQGATGYILEYKDLCVYFAGDTGYDSVAFKKIGNKFKIDLAFIPVGPCRNCDSIGFRHHTSSIEALELFRDIKAKHMIPIHYGAFKYMSDENRPLTVMENLLFTLKFDDLREKVTILNVGEQVMFNE
jgi:L-ascorbate metabolism protein UlaG (beta-lactamase superfamily)